MYQDLTQKQIEERMHLVSDGLWAVAISEDLAEEIDRISKEAPLTDDQKIALARIIGLVFLGFVNRAEFRGAVLNELKELGADEELVEEVGDIIEEGVFDPIGKELDEFYKSMNPDNKNEGGVAPIPEKGVPLVRPKPAQEKMQTGAPTPELQISPAPPAQTPPPPATPFVIHEREEPEAVVEGSGYVGDLVRPSFYSDTEKSSEYTEQTPAARLELGNEDPGTQVEPTTAKVGKENARVVHYSAPEAPADPFAQTPMLKPNSSPTSEIPKKQVPKNNVVNLKDLPQ
ncbi:MAG: hypothetical protein COT89_01750 [Candidatus Colwellbacteria bacterium CG10_big_fil_rev_8_21_14_0_10_42_22]|uniref:Uncharacterized protein n=1 Tax=Candidatus Colwellbacteria bacterium CG10_big_fil_rev_8_21_14_0_10_42_22 TaxID=1974540 RepID=A0A2H0VFU6_9BACT|nr:MAG: hypothetical protein COT89_01750 [Candidatus Colwellbacteria bacterium CG10_big_fil_rev_8_21_14_0_10_42_22]